MSLATKSLLSSRPVFDGSPTPPSGAGQYREKFVSDATCGCGDAKREEPLSPVASTHNAGGHEGRDGDGEEAALQSDVPDLCLEPGSYESMT